MTNSNKSVLRSTTDVSVSDGSSLRSNKKVLFSDALDRSRLVSPLEKDDGEKKEVLCAVYFIHGKNKSPVFSGKVRLPASLFGNENYGFYLRDEEKEAAVARAIVERDERRANRKNEREFS